MKDLDEMEEQAMPQRTAPMLVCCSNALPQCSLLSVASVITLTLTLRASVITLTLTLRASVITHGVLDRFLPYKVQ